MRKHIILYLCDALRSCGSFVSRNWSGRCYGSGGRVSTFVFGSPRFKSRRRRRVWFIHHLHGPPNGNTHISLRVLPCDGSSDLANGQSLSKSRLMADRRVPRLCVRGLSQTRRAALHHYGGGRSRPAGGFVVPDTRTLPVPSTGLVIDTCCGWGGGGAAPAWSLGTSWLDRKAETIPTAARATTTIVMRCITHLPSETGGSLPQSREPGACALNLL